MLNHISIKNFAIIDNLELDLFDGMTSLTGETGAGKSILLDAIGLVLGDRADSNSVRHGCDKADISASFAIETIPELNAWLNDNDLENGDECIIRRVVSADGRSRAYINGSTATLQQIKTAGEMLIDIHGQHEHQSLMRRDSQRRLLDDYAKLGTEIESIRSAYTEWFDAEHRLDELKSRATDRSERLELLSYHVNELEAHSPVENEYDALVAEHNQLANIDKHISVSAGISDVLYDHEESLYNALSQQINRLAQLNADNDSLNTLGELLTEAQAQVSEAASVAKNYLDNLENDPEKLNQVEQRLDTIHELCRKHQCEPEELFSLFEKLQQELEELTNADESLDKLMQQRDSLKQAYLKQAQVLSKKRIKAAKELSTKITDAMQALNMKGGVFEISVSQSEPLKCAAEGFDAIEYLVSANPGQPAKPLSKVASGGELARISLAIQMITADQTHIPTLIFDEVDSGVGGATAEIVGQHLRAIGEKCQVLCVTHLPQVAAQAHHHLQVNKTTSRDSTSTSIEVLDGDSRQHEIARMLGGVEITQQTLDHAQEMIQRAQGA